MAEKPEFACQVPEWYTDSCCSATRCALPFPSFVNPHTHTPLHAFTLIHTHTINVWKCVSTTLLGSMSSTCQRCDETFWLPSFLLSLPFPHTDAQNRQHTLSCCFYIQNFSIQWQWMFVDWSIIDCWSVLLELNSAVLLRSRGLWLFGHLLW